VAHLLPFGDHRPQLGGGVFLAETATVIGNVVIGEAASVWYGALLRGDVGAIVVGARTNVQDNAVLHLTGGGPPCVVGEDVTIGHGAVVHGCTVEDRCLIGIAATVLDGSVIGAGSVVSAGAVVTPRSVVPPGSLVAGVPAKVLRPVSEAQAELGARTAADYVALARQVLDERTQRNEGGTTG